MAMKFNPNFEGEDVGVLLDTIAKELEEDEIRPGKAVTKNLSNIFAHLAQATACLREMHTKLGQVHTDLRPENLLLHYGKDREIVYLLNDFDSSYWGRLNQDKYGEKAKAIPVRDEDGVTMRSDFKHYTYEDMMKHLQMKSES